MTSIRHQLLADAALSVLASHGSRGLTHRMVDTTAGVPPGSTSSYYGTRAALLGACVWRLIERDQAQLDTLTPLLIAKEPATLAQALADVLHRWLTTDRDRHLARYELSLEAVRRPELAAELYAAGRQLRERIALVLASFGAPDPTRQARWLVACIDGILFDNIAGAGAADPIDASEIQAAARSLIYAALPERDAKTT